MKSEHYTDRDMGDGVRCRWNHDPTYDPGGQFPDETEEEVERERQNLESGKWVVLGCIVQRKADCSCPKCDGWHEEDSCWGIVIEPDGAKLDEYARKCMGVTSEEPAAT